LPSWANTDEESTKTNVQVIAYCINKKLEL
jgi:hypothetical protein